MNLSFTEMLAYVLYGMAIYWIGNRLRYKNKKFSVIVEITLAIIALIYIFTQMEFLESFPYIFYLGAGYSMILTITDGKEKADQLKEKLQTVTTTNVLLTKNVKRLFTDLSITFVVFFTAILFLIFVPEPNALKYVILIGFMFVIPEVIKRTFTYFTVSVSYSDTKLYIVSRYDAREIPFDDIEDVQLLTNVDILKLHPLLTFLSTRSDFTTSLGQTITIRLPSEEVFLTVAQPETLYYFIEKKRVLNEEEATIDTKEPLQVLPFYHWKNIRRLLGKLYFSITVKGISAYTGLFLIMYFLNTPEWLMITIILLFWLINLYYSDRVLQIAMDAEEIHDPKIKEVANRVFSKAGIQNVKVYQTESNDFNGLATGMNIGRAMVTLTTATMKMPLEHIEGILAHEAVHVKKRDVLLGQLLRIPYILFVIGLVLYFQQSGINLEEYLVPIFFVVWFLMLLFPVYQSFYMQWMEVRADHYGSQFLGGGKRQMAESLKSLGAHQDIATKKMMEYRFTDEEREGYQSILVRGSWFIRFLEFQFLPHPPMYWRVQSLEDDNVGWKNGILKQWMKDRLKESFSK